jgi:hypothetical protein
VHAIDHYQQNDLYNVLRALDEGIKQHKQDEIIKDIVELEHVMDNILKDADRISINAKESRMALV